MAKAHGSKEWESAGVVPDLQAGISKQPIPAIIERPPRVKPFVDLTGGVFVETFDFLP
jgi:hypothetical protein